MAYIREKCLTREVKEEIFNYCKSRWDFYKEQDGAYYPSKHDVKVITDAAEHYGIRYQDANEIYDEVSKEKAKAMVKGMTKAQMAQMFDGIVKGNAETPWGQMELNKKK